MNVESYRPQAEVTFFTEKGNLVARATNDPNSRFDDDIVSLSTNRNMLEDCPTFEIQLSNRKPWHKWVASNDLVIIQTARAPEAKSVVFIGLVDDCRKTTSVSGNSVQRRISIKGRGLAKSLIRFDVGIVPEADLELSGSGWVEKAGIVLSANKPGAIVQAIWNIIIKGHINYTWNNGMSLLSYFDVKTSDMANIQLLDADSLAHYAGSVHSMVRTVAEDPFYEVFYEVSGGKVIQNVRPTPFNQAEWNALPHISIADADVVSDSIGRSDVEAYSIFSVGAKTLFSSEDTYKTFGSLPLQNKKMAEKYGNARLHVETAYTKVAEGADVPLQTDTLKQLMIDLYNWNIKNNSMFNGTVIVKGSPKYKVGTRISYNSVEDGSNCEFYVVGVTHNFVNFGSYTTTLSVTRGLPASERFTAPWGGYQEYAGLMRDLVPYDPVKAKENLQIPWNYESVGSVDTTKMLSLIDGCYDVYQNGVTGAVGTHKVKYVYGADDPLMGRFDCSSWTKYMYSKYVGINIGRTCRQQVKTGVSVPQDKIQAGDLILFQGTQSKFGAGVASHVAIYLGNILDTSTGKTTRKIMHNANEDDDLKISDLDSSWYQQHYLEARRVLGGEQVNGDAPTGQLLGTFEATAYGSTRMNGGAGTHKTASGRTPVEKRTIAVDRSVIPLGSVVQITCPTYPQIDGEYWAEDTGGAIKGKKIDIYFDDWYVGTGSHFEANEYAQAARQRMLDFGRRNITVYLKSVGKG